MLDNTDLIRAQYDLREHRNNYAASTRYNFLAPIVERDGGFQHEVTVSSKATGKVYHHSFETDPNKIDDIFAEWWTQLEVRETSTAMWGQ
jgi:hypothetical protein